jgi:hypothetical protein
MAERRGGRCAMRKALTWKPWKGFHAFPRWFAPSKARRLPTRLACCCSLLVLAACGGGHKTGGTNSVALVVDPGPPEAEYAYLNGPFASVTLCVPGSTDCQTIDHLLVDTGSVGVRVLGSVLTLPLPLAQTDGGQLLAECFPFVSGEAWGLVRKADVKIGGELAGNIPIQVIGDTAASDNIAIPPSCNESLITGLNDDAALRRQGLGCNGILGVGLQPVDCGPRCPATSSYSIYFACTSSCRPISIPVAQQIPNPVAAFPVDNNGVILQLPDVPETGARSVSGVMVFGIGTQSNNGLGSAQVLTSSSWGYVRTAFPAGGEEYVALLDSGSNGMFLLDDETSGLAPCRSDIAPGWYCPPSTTKLAATILGLGAGEAVPIDFSVANFVDLVGSSDQNCAFSDTAGAFPGFPDPDLPAFDWGLPFYLGRRIYHAIDGAETPAGPGPYFAF